LGVAFNSLKGQNFSVTDSVYYIQLSDLPLLNSERNSGRFRIAQPDGPCMSELIYSSDGQRFTVTSSDLKAQGHITNDLFFTNKLVVVDFYGLNRTMKIDYIGDFPFFYTFDNALFEPIYQSKFSMTYEEFRSEKAIAYFGNNFSAIQVAGNANMDITRHGQKSVFIGNISREVNLVSYVLVHEPTSAFIIDENSEIKNLSKNELKRWFPERTQTIWVFYDAETGRTLWKSDLKGLTKMSNNWLFLDQPIKNKPTCGELGAANAYLYPNPSFGDIKLKIQDFTKGMYTFEVYNVIGKTLFSEAILINSDSVITEFRLNGLSKGTYLYSIKDESGRRVQSKRLTIVGY
jgi:hydrogenase maturation factor